MIICVRKRKKEKITTLSHAAKINVSKDQDESKIAKQLLSYREEKTLTPHKASTIYEGLKEKLILTTEKVKIKESDIKYLLECINNELKKRLLKLTDNKFIDVDEKLSEVKFKTNQNENIDFGSGTVIDIPENINVIRTASYWKKIDSDQQSAYWVLSSS